MIDIAVVGLGYWGPNLVRNFARINKVRIKYLCDLDRNSIDRVAYLVPDAVKTHDYDRLLEDDAVKAVVVATSAATHYELARKAIEAGKHVYVEKPLALSVAEGEELVRLAEESGVVLMVGHLMLYHPAVSMLKELVDSGELGEIYYLYSQRLNLGRLRRDENVIWSLAPHDFSMILYLKNSSPVRVQCNGGDYLQDGIEDVAFVSVYFEDGSMGHVHVSWLDPHKIRKLTVVGSKKMAVFDDMESTEKIRIYDKGVKEVPATAPYSAGLTLRFGDITIPYIEMKEPLLLECEHFIDCVLNNKRPVSDGRNGLEVLKVLDACDRSISSGGAPVEIG